mmetsp:Transcript_13817/g.30884  ORF Transcript_13817/g.30884 Transcript_13817/m.30884 type:complete len:508 (-) Transcript_13817:993-2516(-)
MVDATNPSGPSYDLIVIGGGVVGLACLRAATLNGWKCALVEAESHLLSHASGGNSGIVCTGVDAAVGTLERALIRDSISQFRTYCDAHSIPSRPCGSLVCVFPWDLFCGDETGPNDNDNGDDNNDGDDDSDNDNDQGNESDTDHVPLLHKVLEESHIAGDCNATLFPTGSEILEGKERNISSSLLGAVHIPGEIVVDSWVYSVSLAAHALENGADIYTDFRVDSVSRSDTGEDGGEGEGLWTIGRARENPSNSSEIPPVLRGRAVVNATGNWSDLTEISAHGVSEWVTKPRRGQYRVYNSDPLTRITHPLQPIPSQRTKGIFVYSTLHNQIVVGPTALDQSSKTDRSVDPEVASKLDEHVRRVIPHIDTEAAHVGDFVGIRPGTDRRDYQIHLNPKKQWVAVAGIRSTGLTASLGIGNYVVRLLQVVLEDPGRRMRPRDTNSYRGNNETNSNEVKIRTTPMPTIDQLAHDFVAHGDGCCAINGRRYRVTHPLTRFGFGSVVSRSQSE